MLIEITYNVTDVYMSTTETPVYVEISFEQPGSASAVWGSITGTLSNQTDLQNALNAKFDDPTGTTFQYIDGTGALQTFPLTLPVLQEVRNQTGATLDAGTVVYINGATGNKPTVTKAIATGDATSAQTLGMISAAIANNGVGYVVVIGTCGGLDTSAYTEGQQLYLSYTTAGAVTTTKPYAPNHLVYVGIVTRSHPNLGTIEVRVQNGFEMDEIHNVSAQTPSNNDGLFYNTSTSLWESKSITTALGYTPVPTTRNITINGVTYDLSADRTWTIAAGISGSGASGQVTYWTGASAVSGSNNLFWDNANARLGIGTNAPTSKLHISTPSIGVTQSDANGLLLKNETPATASLNQNSPAIVLSGSGWKSNAPAQSTESSWRISSTPLTGSSNVESRLTFEVAQNTTGSYFTTGFYVYVDRFSNTTVFTSTLNTQTISGLTSLTIGKTNPLNTNQQLVISGDVSLTSGTYSAISNAAGVGSTSGSLSFNAYGYFGTINQTGGANGITRGLYVNPTLTAAASWRSIEWSNNSGWGLYGGGTANNYLGGSLGIGTTSVTNWLNIAASTTAKAHINLVAGSTPTAPANGDIWFDGTDIKMRISGVTKTFTLI